jgi:hypothetical protein
VVVIEAVDVVRWNADIGWWAESRGKKARTVKSYGERKDGDDGRKSEEESEGYDERGRIRCLSLQSIWSGGWFI